MCVSAGLSSQGGGVLAEEMSLGRLRRYRMDAEDKNLLVIEDSQVRLHYSQCSNFLTGIFWWEHEHGACHEKGQVF